MSKELIEKIMARAIEDILFILEYEADEIEELRKILKPELQPLGELLKEMGEMLIDIRDNYDCECLPRYDHECQACKAEQALQKYREFTEGKEK